MKGMSPALSIILFTIAYSFKNNTNHYTYEYNPIQRILFSSLFTLFFSSLFSSLFSSIIIFLIACNLGCRCSIYPRGKVKCKDSFSVLSKTIFWLLRQHLAGCNLYCWVATALHIILRYQYRCKCLTFSILSIMNIFLARMIS